MSRYTGPMRVRASTPDAQRYEDTARTLVGELELRGQPVNAARVTLPDGGTVAVRVAGSQREATLVAPPAGAQAPGGMEEMVHVFVSADDGLHVYDLSSKRLVQRITGLEPYTVHAVDRGAAFLTNPNATGQLVAVRVDLSALTAFGYVYTVKTPNSPSSSPPLDGLATALDAGGFALAPDGTRALLHFGGSMTTAGATREGIGGHLLIDAATLAPLRPAIRMSFKPGRAAWSPDSQRFYLGVSLFADAGDDVTSAHLSALGSATSDGVAMFDRDGVLLGSAVLATWSFTPSTGFVRLLQALGADSRYVYAATIHDLGGGSGPPSLHVLTAALAPVATLDLSGIAAVPPAQLVPMGSTLYAVYSDRIAAFAIADDGTPTLAGVTVHPDLATLAPNRSDAAATLRPGVSSRVGRPPDTRRFLFRQAAGVAAIVGYRGFAPGPDGAPRAAYTLDLRALDPARTWHTDFALANAGTRPIPGRRDGGVTPQ